MGRGRIRRAWSALWKPIPPRAPVPNAECPICRRPVVASPTTYLGNAYSGPMMVPHTRQELVAACAVHGRPPFNEATIRATGADPDGPASGQ